MVRTEVQFEKAEYEAIRRLADRKRISISEAVRQLVGASLQGGPEKGDERNGVAALLEVAGIGASGLPDLGRRHDDYLAEDLGR
jgi:hypothetical protein